MVYILKIGGDITSNPENIRKVKSLLDEKVEKEKVILVASGMRGVTDDLIDYTHKFDKPLKVLIKDLADKHYELGASLGLRYDDISKVITPELVSLGEDLKFLDKHRSDDKKASEDVISSGERLLCSILGVYLSETSPWKFNKVTTGKDIGILTDENYGNAKIIRKDAKENVNKYYDEFMNNPNRLLIVTGFDGTDGKHRTTLGRSGSDQTTTFLAYALGADSVHLIKSVKGIMTADPKLVTDARTINKLSYELAREAGNVQEEAVIWAREANIPMYVHFIDDMETKTKVQTSNGEQGYKLITGTEKAVYISIGNIRDTPGTAHQITGILFNNGLNSAMISEGRNSIGFTIDNSKDYNLESAKKELIAEGYQVRNPEECSLIRGVGEITDDDHLDFMNAFREFKKQSGLESPFSKSAYDSDTYSASISIPRKHYKNAIRFMHDKLV